MAGVRQECGNTDHIFEGKQQGNEATEASVKKGEGAEGRVGS